MGMQWPLSHTLRFLRVTGVASKGEVTPGQETCINKALPMADTLCWWKMCAFCQTMESLSSWDIVENFIARMVTMQKSSHEFFSCCNCQL